MKTKTRKELSLADVLAHYAGHAEFPSPPKDANARGADNSILNIAAYRGQLQHVTVLVAHGADINFKGDMGNTPLHDAVESSHLGVVEFLLAQGGNPLIQNEFGKTALDEAVDRGFKDIAALLRKASKR